MPSTLYTSNVGSYELRDEVEKRELCRVTLIAGTKYLVQAQGLIRGPGPEVVATLMLTVFEYGGNFLDERAVQLRVDSQPQTFSLMLAAEIEPAGGAGSVGAPEPPKPSATLSITLRGAVLAFEPAGDPPTSSLEW
jgi:hypothetical protein